MTHECLMACPYLTIFACHRACWKYFCRQDEYCHVAATECSVYNTNIFVSEYISVHENDGRLGPLHYFGCLHVRKWSSLQRRIGAGSRELRDIG